MLILRSNSFKQFCDVNLLYKYPPDSFRFDVRAIIAPDAHDDSHDPVIIQFISGSLDYQNAYILSIIRH